jgi:hypothetical protein
MRLIVTSFAKWIDGGTLHPYRSVFKISERRFVFPNPGKAVDSEKSRLTPGTQKFDSSQIPQWAGRATLPDIGTWKNAPSPENPLVIQTMKL